MKIILKLIILIIIILIISGYIVNNNTTNNGKFYIGIGVSLFAFIFMPLFVYYRYKNRIGEYVDKRMEQPKDNNNS